MNKIFLSNVTIRHNTPHIKDTNIPVNLIVGKSMNEIKTDYPWLTKKQIEKALVFMQEIIRSQDFTKHAPNKKEK